MKEKIYLNANIIYGDSLKCIAKPTWKRTIKTGILERIAQNYDLTTSILTKMEVIQRLMREENCSNKMARKAFQTTVQKFNISIIASINKFNILTNTFLDRVAIANLDFKDAIHLEIASKSRLLLVTHDKKFHKAFSQHPDKQKFYTQVVKPEDI